jgi:hypothetical protein
MRTTQAKEQLPKTTRFSFRTPRRGISRPTQAPFRTAPSPQDIFRVARQTADYSKIGKIVGHLSRELEVNYPKGKQPDTQSIPILRDIGNFKVKQKTTPFLKGWSTQITRRGIGTHSRAQHVLGMILNREPITKPRHIQTASKILRHLESTWRLKAPLPRDLSQEHTFRILAATIRSSSETDIENISSEMAVASMKRKVLRLLSQLANSNQSEQPERRLAEGIYQCIKGLGDASGKRDMNENQSKTLAMTGIRRIFLLNGVCADLTEFVILAGQQCEALSASVQEVSEGSGQTAESRLEIDGLRRNMTQLKGLRKVYLGLSNGLMKSVSVEVLLEASSQSERLPEGERVKESKHLSVKQSSYSSSSPSPASSPASEKEQPGLRPLRIWQVAKPSDGVAASPSVVSLPNSNQSDEDTDPIRQPSFVRIHLISETMTPVQGRIASARSTRQEAQVPTERPVPAKRGWNLLGRLQRRLFG